MSNFESCRSFRDGQPAIRIRKWRRTRRRQEQGQGEEEIRAAGADPSRKEAKTGQGLIPSSSIQLA